MKKEKSCGSIVFYKNKILLVKHNLGHWDFPKGHVENGEREQETAIREVKEETNIDISIKLDNRYVITYNPLKDVEKDVVFFIGKALNNKIIEQKEEIEIAKFATIKEALNLITYDNSKEMLKKALLDLNIMI